LRGPEWEVLADLLEFIRVHDTDVILFPYADTWVPLIIRRPRRYGLEPTFSRSGWFKLASKSYRSYGKVNHKDGALIPEGRVLIDTAKSFVYNEGGLKEFQWPPACRDSPQKPDRPLHARDAHLLLRGLRGSEERHSSAFQKTGCRKY
jgi:hypothetical protein